ncbi:hypothetical protein PITC_083620 [Penicillium italicum]|uniref:Uncharacterized protein n=1 Tax=Penicillium italicum TaxID=40296 RepID=A0A0A2L6D0_PENIT|nr:hypothetical protein PITC_083620 [Penicillium italicum]
MNRQFSPKSFPPKRQWPEMPPKVVHFMFTTIGTSDAICFALSCKFTLDLYLLILEKLGRTMPVTPQPMFLDIKGFPWIRIRLLRRLQNSRWKICAQCWTLHPRSIWKLQPFWRLDHKKCFYGCDTLGSRKCYLPYAGEVDMCPCSILNTHHKLQLISLCRRPPLDSKGGVQHLTNRSCKCEMLLHTCTFNKHPIAQVQINVSFSFGCQDQSLRMRTRFLFDFTNSTPSQLENFWNERSHICMREKTGEWVGRFFREGKNLFGGKMDWTPCEWFSWDVSDEGPLEITLNRNLGKREWPSKSWNRNCRKFSK